MLAVACGVLALAVASVAGAEDVSTIELFVSAATPVSLNTFESRTSSSVAVYPIDALEELQNTLSRDLPADPEAAKPLALAGLERVGANQMAQLKSASLGLAKAYQYGLDRYPAVVFDGRAVVYGVTDLAEALAIYTTWRER